MTTATDELRTSGPEAETTVVSVRALSKTYSSKDGDHQALADISFDVKRGEIVAIVGPSGAGKTTVLRCVAGLIAPTSGTVEIEGAPVTKPPEQVGVVFQDYSRSLMPWLSALGNVTLPLRAKGVARNAARAQALEALAAVGLEGRENVHPRQLSGGMQQRVAIARALAYKPDLLLMDEPFASVDAQTRLDLEDLVPPLRDRFGISIVIVTHDVDEAIYLGDRVVVLSKTPATVQRVIDVELPSPRGQRRTKQLPQFGTLRSEVLSLIRRPTNPDLPLESATVGGSGPVTTSDANYHVEPK